MVTVDPYLDEKRATDYFGLKKFATDVLPVLVVIKNKGTSPVFVKPEKNLFLETACPQAPLNREAAAGKAENLEERRQEAIDKAYRTPLALAPFMKAGAAGIGAAGNTLPLPLALAPIISTSYLALTIGLPHPNPLIDMKIEAKGLPEKIIGAGGTVSGFVYFPRSTASAICVVITDAEEHPVNSFRFPLRED